MTLNLLLGPVFSGKTTELVRHAHRFDAIQWKCLLISPVSPQNSSHAQLSWENHIFTASLIDVDVNPYQIILIDDAHFFGKEFSIVETWLQSKTLYVAGLDADSNGVPYRDLLSWIPHADTVKKMTALIRKPKTRFEQANLSQEDPLATEDDVNKVLQMSPSSLKLSPSHKYSNYRPTRTNGELTLIMGPMFAGKTTELLRQATRYFHAGAHILFINHEWNARYGTIEICSHDGVKAGQTTWNSPRVHFMRKGKLQEIPQEKDHPIWTKIDAIFVEECQFFPDAQQMIPEWLKQGKDVFISGLDGDANKKPFGDLCWLVPWATYLEKQTALCRQCGDGTPAPFTRRFAPSTDQVDVGTSDKYEAVCRKHF